MAQHHSAFRIIFLAVAFAVAQTPCAAGGANPPRLWSDPEYLQWLTGHEKSRPRFAASGIVNFDARNNLIPLSLVGEHRFPARQAPAESPFFLLGANGAVRLQLRSWTFFYSEVWDDSYDGNPDAGRLFLLAKAKQLKGAGPFDVAASLHRKEGTAFGAFREGTIPGLGRRADYRVGARFLSLPTYRDGWIRGTYNGGQFAGSLYLQSTKDLDAHGYGFSADGLLRVELAPSLQMMLGMEGLAGWTRWNRVHFLKGDFQTDKVEPDANGFLREAPLVHGVDAVAPLTLDFRPRLVTGLAAPIRGFTAFWMAESGASTLFHTLGARWPCGKAAWYAYFRTPGEGVGLGYQRREFVAHVFASNVARPGDSSNFAASLQVPLY